MDDQRMKEMIAAAMPRARSIKPDITEEEVTAIIRKYLQKYMDRRGY